MSLYALRCKDKKNRLILKKLEYKRLVLKALCHNIDLPLFLREYIFSLLFYFRKKSFVHLRNRCVFSNKPRYIFTKYKVSRMAFKRLLILKRIPGLYKSSW